MVIGKDNGRGFESGKVVSGYGLHGIRERSQLLDGKMTLQSQPEQGTRLKIIVPLVEENKFNRNRADENKTNDRKRSTDSIPAKHMF